MTGIIRRLAGVLSILVLAVLLAGVPLLLWRLSQPVMPKTMPSWNQIVSALFSQDDGTLIVGLLVVVAWLAWAYLAVALLVEIWAAIRRVPAPRLRGFALPQGVAQRLVSAALLAFIAIPAVGNIAYADTGTNSNSTSTQTALTDTQPAVEAAEPVVDAKPVEQRQVVRHTVTPSDTLIRLAKQYLGDGDRYLEIFEANKGMVQANGRRLVDPDLIVDGTELKITLDTPAKRAAVQTDDAAAEQQKPVEQRQVVRHTVTPSDTLIRLAKQYLGDGDRYLEIFEANKGMVQANGRRLVDPDLIVDGTKLTIILDAAAQPSAPAEPVVDEATEPAPPAPTPTPSSTPAATPSATPSATPITTAEAAAQLQAVVQELHDEQTESPYGIRTSFGVGAIAAAGVVSLIGTRRFLQRRARRRGAIMAMPVGRAAQIEHELRATANPLAIEEVDLALRSLAAHCQKAGTALPEIRVARLTATTLELYTTEPELLPTPWAPTANGMLWSIQADDVDELDKEALSEIPAPYPALVCLGQDLEDAHVLVDLETVSEINVDGPQEAAEEVLAAMALELATSLWADDLNVTLVGAFPEMEDVLQTGRIRYLPTVGRLFEELQLRAENDRLQLDIDNVSNPHHARISAVAQSTWFPEIVMLTRPLTPVQTDQLSRLLTDLPRVAIASVAITEQAGEWSVNLQDDGTAIIEPLRLTINPQQISTAAYQQVLEIVDVANHGQEIANEATPEIVDELFTDMTAYLSAGEFPAHPDDRLNPVDENSVEQPQPLEDLEDQDNAELNQMPTQPLGPVEGTPYLRVLGPVEVVGAEGPVEPNRAARLTEYLAYLVLAETPLTGRGIDDAIWPNRTKEDNSSTRAPATSRLRKWLGTTDAGQLRLDVNNFVVSGVDCDWHQFAAATDGPLDQIPTEQLTAALELVRGTPFKSAAVKNLYYAWAEPLVMTMISRIVDVVYEVAARQLVNEAWLECEKTLSIGIDIEPGDEQLWRMRILAAYGRHNQPAIEEASARLFAQLAAFDVAPEPQTTDFLHALNQGADVTDLMEKI